VKNLPPYTLYQCPFCGDMEAPKLFTNLELAMPSVLQMHTVCCSIVDDYGCGATCGYHTTEAEAIAAWNTRCDE